MGLASSKNVENKYLYEPIQIHSPMTRYHMLHVAMSDAGLVEVTIDDYRRSKKYVEEKGVELAR